MTSCRSSSRPLDDFHLFALAFARVVFGIALARGEISAQAHGDRAGRNFRQSGTTMISASDPRRP